MFNFLLLFNVVFILNVFIISAKISNKRLCANEDCTKLISKGKTVVGYGNPTGDPRILSYGKNQNVKIYSKSAGTNSKLWGAEINGKRGYVFEKHILENSVDVTPELEVDTEELPVIQEDSRQSVTPQPSKPYVVDGTTLYEHSSISTEAPASDNVLDVNLNEQTEPLKVVPTQDNRPNVKPIVHNTNFEPVKQVEPQVPDKATQEASLDKKNSELKDNNDQTTPKTETLIQNDSNVKLNQVDRLAEVVQTEAKEIENNAPAANNDTQKPNDLVQSEPLGFKPADIDEVKIKEVVQQEVVDTTSSSATETPKTPLDQEDKIPEGSLEHNSTKPEQDDDNEEEDGDDELEDGIVEEEDEDEVQVETPILTKPTFKEEPKDSVHEYNYEPYKEAAMDTSNLQPGRLDEPKDSVHEYNHGPHKEAAMNTSNLQPGGLDEPKDSVDENNYEPHKEAAMDTSNLQPGRLDEPKDSVHEYNHEPQKEEAMDTSNLQPGKVDEVIKESEETNAELPKSETENSKTSNPLDAHTNVVTDNTMKPSEDLFNETETATASLNNLKQIPEGSVSGEVHQRDHENGNYLFNKENVLPLPPLLQKHHEKEPHSHDYSYEHVDINDSGNHNNKDEYSSNYMEMQQNTFDHYNSVEKLSKEEVKQEEEKENKHQLNQDEIHSTERIESHKHDINSLLSQHVNDELSCSADPLSDCKIHPQSIYYSENIFKFPNPAIISVLVIAAVTVVTFLWGYMYMEKRGRESNLIGKINNIQKEFLIVKKENEILKDKLEDVESEFKEKANTISNEMLLEVQEKLKTEKNTRSSLELQIQNLEKELENSTEVGLELNRMLSEFLNSENGSETLVANIEQLQRQIIEQQAIINAYNENLSMKDTENHELRLEVDINNAKVTDLQSELNKMALNLLKLEEEKEQLQTTSESELEKIKEELESKKVSFAKEKNKFKEQLQDIRDKYDQVQRELEVKSNEYSLLKESINQIKKIGNNGDALKSLLDVSAIQAELLQFRKENQLLTEKLQDERNKSEGFEIKCQSAMEDLRSFKEKYDIADREKVEAITKLQVLDKYFKEREAHLQQELSKQESMWIEKQGEATSTIERIKYMQEELQNYKIQNESLKQEILEQEVQMKSQISVLEKKAHENWVSARQAERKLEEAKQEAAQLRNRLTLRERTFTEEKMHNRVQSPLEQNGELPVSPAHIPNDTAASPPLLFGTRENLTISPPLPGLPFLPPPPGVPFMPPPLGGVPLPPGFMPPPPSLMPGDHRPPPLGRISSPPLNSRYSPDRAYSPYSRNSPSPTSDDDYDRMPQPPMYRGYNSYDRREIHRPPPVRANTRSNKGGGHSSGSANSNDSLDKINRHNSKISPFFDYHYEL